MRRGLRLFIGMVAVGLGLLACDPGGGDLKENGSSRISGHTDSSGTMQPGQGATGADPLELLVIDFATRLVTHVMDVPPSSVPAEGLAGGSPEAQALLGEWAALAQQLQSQGESNLTRTKVTFGEAQGMLARLGLGMGSGGRDGAQPGSLALEGRGPGERRCVGRITGAHLLGVAAFMSAVAGPDAAGFAAACLMGGVGMVWIMRPPR